MGGVCGVISRARRDRILYDWIVWIFTDQIIHSAICMSTCIESNCFLLARGADVLCFKYGWVGAVEIGRCWHWNLIVAGVLLLFKCRSRRRKVHTRGRNYLYVDETKYSWWWSVSFACFLLVSIGFSVFHFYTLNRDPQHPPTYMGFIRRRERVTDGPRPSGARPSIDARLGTLQGQQPLCGQVEERVTVIARGMQITWPVVAAVTAAPTVTYCDGTVVV